MHFHTRYFTLLAAASLLMAPVADAAEARVLPNHVPEAVSKARRLGPMSRGAELRLAIGLPLRNQDELDAFIKEVADPTSAHYRAWLTPDEFTLRYGPSETDYATVKTFAESHNLTVTGIHPNRMILDVTGKVSDIESAFNIALTAWSDDQRGSFYAPDRDPSVDASLPILDIVGLDNYVTPRPMNLKTTPLASVSRDAATGSGPSGLLIGNDFRSAYAPGVKLTGTGQTIGLFELDGFYAGDVTANFSAAGLPAVPVQTVLLDGSNGAPGGGNIEVILDIMMAAYMAPGAKIIVYEGYNWNDVLNRMATDNQASQLSSSWGYSPINATTEQIFRQYIAQGQSFFQASGDSGAYTNGVMTPSDDPNLTVVGGTHLSTSGPGGSWIGETAWSGSGGGVSKSYAIPSYQQGIKMAAVGGSTTMRNIPDVALTADVQMFVIYNNGQGTSVGGTSAAAPLWAGFTALANQQAHSKGGNPVGFLNPTLYSLEAPQYAASMHDIISGSNGFQTAPGYDLVTGWGSPAGQGLIDQLTGASSTPSFSISGTPAAVSVLQGATASSAIAITPLSGFSDSVALSVSGLPSGVTASFSAASATTSSVLTLTASATAAPGATTVIVSGKSGTLTSTFSLSVTVASPSSFTIAASPATIGLVQGNSAKSTITLSPVNGFTGSVTLTVSGLPVGVTAALTRGTTANTESLSFSASATATVGIVNVKVTGTSGDITESATIALTVTSVATFSLTATPASVSVAQGGSAASSIAVSSQSGFSSPVAFTVSGLPAGVTAQFSAVTASGTSTLTFAASSSAASGPATVIVSGTSGTLIKTAPISLTVTGTPSFTVGASPASVSVMAGGTASAAILVSAQNGFTGKVTLAVSGLPVGVTAAFASSPTAPGTTLTFTAAATAAAGTATFTVTGTSGTITKTAALALLVLPGADFSLEFPQGSLSIFQGTSGAGLVRISALNGFTGSVALTASGLPTGVTASFTAIGTSGLDTATFTVASTAAKGSSTITLTGTSGVLSHKTTFTLNVLAPAAGTALVNLATIANISGTAIDTVPFTGGGLDNGGRSYSGLLLGASQTIGGIAYSMAPLTGSSAVSGKTVTLPSGQYTALKVLATGLNGNQTGQTFTVNYTDGTKSTFTQSLSDWFKPQNYNGETTAIMMPYRDNSTGTIDGEMFVLYEYTFNLTANKTVSSIVLPNNRNVAVLAMTLTSAASLTK